MSKIKIKITRITICGIKKRDGVITICDLFNKEFLNFNKF